VARKRKYNLLGQKFGLLTVTKLVPKAYQGRDRWLCLCDCGKQCTVSGWALYQGKRISCGCNPAYRRVYNPKYDMIGQKYNRWLVLEIAESRKNNQRFYYKCRCDCGTIREVQGQSLRLGKSKSCGCLQKEVTIKRNTLPKGEASFNALFYVYRKNARKKGLEFKLTKNEFRNITQRECFYCRVKPNTESCHSKAHNGGFTYNGIDRVDNTKGYIHENCVPCCKICNHAKCNLTQEDFLLWLGRAKDNLIQTARLSRLGNLVA